MGIRIHHYKDPYLTTSILESKRVFFVVQLLFLYFSSAASDLENPKKNGNKSTAGMNSSGDL